MVRGNVGALAQRRELSLCRLRGARIRGCTNVPGLLVSSAVAAPRRGQAAGREIEQWRAGDDPDVAVATRRIGTDELPVELRVASDGQPQTVSMQRWANPNGEPYGYYPFGGIIDDEATFGGITIPSAVRVGYWLGTERWNDGEFVRTWITDATFLEASL